MGGASMGPSPSEPSARLAPALSLLRIAVIAGFFCALLLGVFLPIYTDEIGWRFQERAGLDGVDKMFSDLCGPNSLARPPWFMWPVRMLSAAVNPVFAAPYWLRVSGVLYALAWGVMLFALIDRLTADRRERATLAIIGFGLMCLANTPLLLVMSRPEQPLLLVTTAALILAIPRHGAPPERATPPVTAWLRSLWLLVIAVIALSYHLKALFLAPVFLGVLVLVSRGRAAVPARAVAGLLLVAAILVGARYWADRLACPGDAVLRAEYARNSAAAMFVTVHRLSDLPPLLRSLGANLNLLDYVSLARPEPEPLSDWLPHGQVSHAVSSLWDAALRLLWLLALGLGLFALPVATLRATRERRLDPRLILAGGLMVSLFGWGATRLVRNFYEASFMLPLMMIAVLLVVSAATGNRPLRKAGTAIALVIGIAGLLSIPLTIAIWKDSLIQSWLQEGYIRDQGHSVAFRHFNHTRREIRATAQLCHIPPPDRARGLMLDDLSYFPYMISRLPQHQLGVVGIWKGTITDPVAYLRSRGSDGMLVSCVLLSPELLQRAHRHGDFCCLGPPDW
jgi:hypothetical protein